MTGVDLTHRLPDEGCPFGDGRTIVVVVPEDVLSLHGNLVVKAGEYEAQQALGEPEGNVVLWSYAHHVKGGMWVSLVPQDWVFPGEAKRPIPEHDCMDPNNWKSGVAGGIFCIVCRTEVTP